jgi:hypothetical protein
VIPAWVACQDGDGAWKTLTGTNGTYTFQVTNGDGRYGVAIGLTDQLSDGTTEYTSQVWQANRAEISSITFSGPTASFVSVGGTVNGVSVGDTAYAYLQLGGKAVTGGAFSGLPTKVGTNDFFVKSRNSSGQPTAYYLQRGLSIPDTGATLPPVDLVASGAAPVQIPMAVAGLNGATGTVQLNYLSPNGTNPFLNGGSTTGSLTGFVLPTGMRGPNDLYYLKAQVSTQIGYKITDLSEAVPTAALPSAAVSGLQVSLVQNPTRGRLQWVAVPGTTYYALWGSQTQTAGTAICDVMATPGWLGGGSVLQYTQPDFTSVAGYSLNWLFSTTATANLEVVSYTYSDGWVYGKPIPPYKAGDACQYSWMDATITPTVGAQKLLRAPVPCREPREARSQGMRDPE